MHIYMYFKYHYIEDLQVLQYCSRMLHMHNTSSATLYGYYATIVIKSKMNENYTLAYYTQLFAYYTFERCSKELSIMLNNYHTHNNCSYTTAHKILMTTLTQLGSSCYLLIIPIIVIVMLCCSACIFDLLCSILCL